MSNETETPVEVNSLPHGIGLSLEQVRTLLVNMHNSPVSQDDPILMVATMLNAYLGQIETQNERLKEGLKQLLTAKSKEYVNGVKASTDTLAKSLSDSSVEKLLKFKDSLWTATTIIALSALINVATFIAIALHK